MGEFIQGWILQSEYNTEEEKERTEHPWKENDFNNEQ